MVIDMKGKILSIIAKCNDEKMAKRLTKRVAHRYCATHGVSNKFDEQTGRVIRPTLPSIPAMLDSMNGRDFEVILKSRPFRIIEDIGDIMVDVKCNECWECAGEDCPVLSQQIKDDNAAYHQMCETEEFIDSCIVDEDGEVVTERELREEGYMGEPGFSSSSDYWGYILG